MKKMLSTLTLSLSIVTSFAAIAQSESTANASVAGFAMAFLYDTGIADGTITILETGQQLKTDKKGHFGPILYPVGKPITLLFEKFGYKTTQSATIIVPEKGLQGPYDNITLQVPSFSIFFIMSKIIGAKIDDESCHVASTITAHHKTLHDLPQGESNAKVTLLPKVNAAPFYFGIFKAGPLKNKTSPFSKDLTETSEDGGVAFFNLPPREELYTLSAEKSGVTFTESRFRCRKGAFINLSPPYGPMVMK